MHYSYKQYKRIKKKEKKKGDRKNPISMILTYAALIGWGLTTIYPFFWVIINSFRERGEIRSDSFSIPWPWTESFTLENYIVAAERSDFANAYLNSLVVSVSVTLVVILLAGFAAYALVRYKFRGSNILYSLIIASMMFPVFSTIIPVFRMEAAWGIASTGQRWLSVFSVILPQIAGNLSFAIVVLIGFIRNLHVSLEESAYIDGCGVVGIYFRIIMPIARPAFATVAIFTFLWSYNDLFTQMFFLRYPKEKTITLLLNEINSQAGVNYGLMTASVVLVVIPVLIVYIALQKNIIKGLTVGAVKG